MDRIRPQKRQLFFLTISKQVVFIVFTLVVCQYGTKRNSKAIFGAFRDETVAICREKLLTISVTVQFFESLVTEK